jgi:hypothetical protein
MSDEVEVINVTRKERWLIMRALVRLASSDGNVRLSIDARRLLEKWRGMVR